MPEIISLDELYEKEFERELLEDPNVPFWAFAVDFERVPVDRVMALTLCRVLR